MLLIDAHLLLGGVLGHLGKVGGVHYLADLLIDEVPILEHLVPHSMEWLADIWDSLSPDVYHCLKVYKFTLLLTRLNLLDHVATSLAALHEKLIQYKVFEVYVVNILWKVHIPSTRGEGNGRLENLIKVLDVVVPD